MISNRYIQGQPELPYANVKTYVNTDVFFDLAFTDHTGALVVPTNIQLELDNITNACAPMLGPVTLVSTGSTIAPLYYGAFATTMTLQIAASVWQTTTTAYFGGSQLCQLKMQFTALDSVTGQPFTSTAPIAIVELVPVQSITGF